MHKHFLCVIIPFVLLFGCRDLEERIDVEIGGEFFRLEVARTEEQRRKGLMFRRSLKSREGMLFVFETDRHLSFWMANTSITLSLAFLSRNGRILQIVDLKPGSLRTVTSKRAARYGLELCSGTFDELGVEPGDYVKFPEGFR